MTETGKYENIQKPIRLPHLRREISARERWRNHIRINTKATLISLYTIFVH